MKRECMSADCRWVEWVPWNWYEEIPVYLQPHFLFVGGAHPDTASQLINTKWWFFHGDADVVVDYQHSVNMVKALEAAGMKAKFSTYEGVNHNSWENAFAEADLLPWLFSHSKL